MKKNSETRGKRMKKNKDMVEIKKRGGKGMDIEEIINILASEGAENVKWTGKMPKGVSGIESTLGYYGWDGYYIVRRPVKIIIELEDRIDYAVIKKICEINNLSIMIDKIEVDEKRERPVVFSIRDKKMRKGIMVERDELSFYADEYFRYKIKKDISEEDGKKIKQKIIGLIKTYLSKVYGGD